MIVHRYPHRDGEVDAAKPVAVAADSAQSPAILNINGISTSIDILVGVDMFDTLIISLKYIVRYLDQGSSLEFRLSPIG